MLLKYLSEQLRDATDWWESVGVLALERCAQWEQKKHRRRLLTSQAAMTHSDRATDCLELRRGPLSAAVPTIDHLKDPQLETDVSVIVLPLG